MMLLALEDSQLVLVDFQTRLLPALHEGASALAQARRLVAMAGLLQVPAFLTEQNPAGLGGSSPQLLAAAGHARVQTLSKTSFSAAAQGLTELLRPAPQAAAGNARSLPKHLQKPVKPEVQRNSIVLAGCETHVCLLQTALDLIEQEFDVWVVTDACASRTERSRDAAFDRLAGAGAELVTVEMVAFEWLRDSRHPAFREIQALIKPLN